MFKYIWNRQCEYKLIHFWHFTFSFFLWLFGFFFHRSALSVWIVKIQVYVPRALLNEIKKKVSIECVYMRDIQIHRMNVSTDFQSKKMQMWFFLSFYLSTICVRIFCAIRMNNCGFLNAGWNWKSNECELFFFSFSCFDVPCDDSRFYPITFSYRLNRPNVCVLEILVYLAILPYNIFK